MIISSASESAAPEGGYAYAYYLPSVQEVVSYLNGLAEALGCMRHPPPEEGGIYKGGAPLMTEKMELKAVIRRIDVEKLRVAWRASAGPDRRMSQIEFRAFVKKHRLPVKHADQLWRMVDCDRNGLADEREFENLVREMSQTNHFCPQCEFESSCDFCLLGTGRTNGAFCAKCDACGAFCPQCWGEHPCNPEDGASVTDASSSSEESSRQPSVEESDNDFDAEAAQEQEAARARSADVLYAAGSRSTGDRIYSACWTASSRYQVDSDPAS